MPEGHTTIGAERFHFRVRNGIGWFALAIATRRTVSIRALTEVSFVPQSGVHRRSVFSAATMAFHVLTLVAFINKMDRSTRITQAIRLLEVIWSSLTGN